MASGFIESIDPPNSVLFLGSGFSLGATNIRNQHVPTSEQLKAELARHLDVDAGRYDLKVLSEALASRSNSLLHQVLYELFTIKEVHGDQLEILQNRWLRIYTTNYDDAAEFSQRHHFKRFSSYNYNDSKPKRLDFNSIVHLHGSVGQLTQDNALDQLILTERSYARQHFESSAWYDDFLRDLRFCNAIFFVGYSLSDHHIAALLLQNPLAIEKTYFIREEAEDKIFYDRVSPYGTVLSAIITLIQHIGDTECRSDRRTMSESKLPTR